MYREYRYLLWNCLGRCFKSEHIQGTSVRIHFVSLAQDCVLAGLFHSVTGFPTELTVMSRRQPIPVLLLHVCLDGLSLGNIGWHPILSVIRQNVLLHILYDKPETWAFVTELLCWICVSVFIYFQDFDSCYALRVLSWIPNDSSVCRSATFIFRPSYAV